MMSLLPAANGESKRCSEICFVNACTEPCAANRSICGPRTTTWTYPRDGYLITEQLGPDGKTHIAFRSPLGR